MHDNVKIYISNGENDEKKEQEGDRSRSSQMNTARSQSARSFTSGYSRTNTSQTASASAGSTTPTRQFSQNKLTTANTNANDKQQKQQQQNRPKSVPPPKSKSRKEIKAAALAMTSAAKQNLSNNRGGGGSEGDIRQKKDTSNNDKPFDEVAAITTTKPKSSLEVVNNNRHHQSNTNYSRTPPRDTKKISRSSSGSSWQSKLSEKLEKNGTNRHLSADVDADTVATAPVQSNDRAYTKNNFKRNESSSGMYHSSTAGTLSPAMAKMSMTESHEERVEREVQQLLLDIQRIEDPNELHCSFGELFCDELVEQYYEALVGTLKAAKKKGLITFKGQMLLKGMSDNVQISIVTE